MFILSSFRDLLQVSGFIDIPVSFTKSKDGQHNGKTGQ
jgi:hypothetical protein